MDASRLNEEYVGGTWDYLRNPTEVARFSVVAGYIHYFRPGGKVLEIGCGEGILQERLNPAGYSRYVGVDVSTAAIARALPKSTDRVSFIAADANVFVADEQFDVIVFNECLEYFDDPLGAVRRYDAALLPAGVIIISMFASADTARTDKIWRSLRAGYRFELGTQIRVGSGLCWNVKVARPRSQ